MTPFEHDIIDLHIALENWLGKGEGEAETLLTRFRPDFLMIPPGGAHLDYHALAHFLDTQRGSRPGLTIVIDELTTIEAWDNGSLHMLQSLSQFLVGSLWLKYAMLIKEDHFSRIDELIT